eukprot:comp22769_c0_seq1/m.35597 comp22769_c0_seq1/g.35597  ORF comp22769_c0_seq1/g.35597 comp22769_c0_seq1/m.35597 type:complete len:600 (-) comp22769_c0_seq1:90-1889(-)
MAPRAGRRAPDRKKATSKPSKEPSLEDLPDNAAAEVQEDAFEIRLGYMEPQVDLKLEKITVAYPGNVLLKDQKLTLVYGRRYGLVGRNGTGKSSLLKCIAQREVEGLPDDLDIHFVDRPTPPSSKTVLQVVLESDWELQLLKTEEDRLCALDDPSQHDLDRLDKVYQRQEEIRADSAESRACSVLSGLEFPPAMLHQAVEELSGGWRMRLALATALFRRPALLLLDQPTNHLDLHSTIWLQEYLACYPKTLVVVSHMEDLLLTVCTNIVHINAGSLLEYSGDFCTYLKARAQRERRQQREYDAQQKKIAQLTDMIERGREAGCPAMAGMMSSRARTLDKMDLVDPVAAEEAVAFSFPDCEELQPPILDFSGVAFGYSPDRVLYRDLNIGIDTHSRIALVGPNGVGKTTLINLFAGNIQPMDGTVRRNKYLRTAIFNQHAVDNISTHQTAVQLLQNKWAATIGRESREHALSHLELFGIDSMHASCPLATLSDGMRARVVFALTCHNDPHIMLLDEPTNHLDLDAINALIDAINRYVGGIVMVSHDTHLISSTCNQIWVCGRDQRVTPYEGTFDEYKRQLVKEMREDHVLVNETKGLALS